MARSLKYIFPGANGDEVCALQDILGGGSLIINGTLSSPIENNVSYISRGYARKTSITSANDLSGVTFTITGTQNGVFTQEDMAGPGAGTSVYGSNYFDVITDVSTDGAAAGVQVGGSYGGFFKIIGVDPWLSPVNYTVRISGEGVIFVNNVTFTLYGTNEDITSNGLLYTDNIAQGIAFGLDTSANSFLFPNIPSYGLGSAYMPLVTNLLVQIDGIPANITRNTILTFTQSGN